MIDADQKLITKTTTYIVVIEGPIFTETPFAFMFLNVEPRDVETAQQKLLSLLRLFPPILSSGHAI